jgi:hypothetical protein
VSEDLDPLVRFQHDIDELTRPRERGQWVQPDKYESTIARPDLAKQRRGGFHWPPKEHPEAGVHLSLLDQLHQLRGGYNVRDTTGSGRGTPGPRPTGGSDVAELLIEITTGAQQLRTEALRHLGVKNTTKPHLPTAAALRHLLVLIDAAGPQLADRMCRQVHSWVNAARLALSYTAPMMALPDRLCHYCGQPALVTRSDASSDVFCSVDGCVDENGERPRWPRATWHLLLTSDQGDTA